MIKNLYVSSSYNKVSKEQIHKLVGLLRTDLNLSIESLYINLVDNNTIRKINNEYLKHNYSTDIITFNYAGDNITIDAEIFISVEEAKLNARKYKVSLSNELIRLIIHGILHLTGYDDNNAKDRIKMKKKENNLLNKYNFSLLRK